MRYLVTGASGFAGRVLTRQLVQAGHQVTGMVRRGGTLEIPGAEEAIADLRHEATVRAVIKKVAPEGIFHLAAPETSVGHSWQEPENAIEANHRTTVSLLGAARSLTTRPKILFVSSAEVLGSVSEAELPQGEDLPPHPENPYALSKTLDESVCRFYDEHFDVPVSIVRSFTYIGPGQRPQFVVARFASEIAKLERTGGGTLQVGNLTARRDFSDVRDMAAAYVAVMEKGQRGETYHAGSGTDCSISELLEHLRGLSTATIEAVVDPALHRPTDIPVMRCDNRKLRNLGWQPTIKIIQTLQEALDEARATLNAEES